MKQILLNFDFMLVNENKKYSHQQHDLLRLFFGFKEWIDLIVEGSIYCFYIFYFTSLAKNKND